MNSFAVTVGGFVAAGEISQQLTSFASDHGGLLWPSPAPT
jgi:hypothetical protein